MIDGHMHLEYGPLSTDYVLAFVRQGEKAGLKEINILDHTHRFKEFASCYDHLKIYPQQKQWLSGKTKFCNTLDEYRLLIEEVKKMDLPVKVRFGLEVCYTKDTEDDLREILKDCHFDFLTGAVHSFRHILYDMKFSKELLWDIYPADDIYRWYYEAVFDCIRSGLFDRLAHPDTIKLFDIYPSFDQKTIYEELAELLKENNMIAENNTGCHYRYGHKDIGLADELLDILVKNKVEIITASDAHHPEDVGRFIKEAEDRIKERKEAYEGKSL